MEMLVNMDLWRRFCPSTDSFHSNFFILVLFYVVRPTAGAIKTPSPIDVVIDQSRLNWNSTASDVTFTVEFKNIEFDWMPIEMCRKTRSTSCDLSLEERDSCIRHRVTAWRNGVESEPVEACSRDGHECSPNFTLTAAPESLTVNLKRNHNLHEDHADIMKYSIKLGKKGEQLENPRVTLSSELIDGLEVGETYCVTVQFLLHWKEYGPASCMQCETIPSSSGSKQTQIIVICFVVLAIALLVVFAYVRLFRFKKIKEILQPPYTIPTTLKKPLSGNNYSVVAMSLPEEHCDVVSGLTPIHPRGV
ncbi:interleukin-10 receptor subunit beta-like [Poeciliopsis prolifica]|uniref:interleukin-10 receptor subunit beta-like n=1 Tax=Poeciliopsis prolifica TaxID=188132 RepID=UPI0024130D8B|nr:interleukin-10 receptor subunit beta-like [Poeciliopsis prolifica]